VVDGQRVKLAVHGYWRCNDTGLALGMVLQGLGIGRLATVAAEPEVRAGTLLPVLAAYVDRQSAPLHAVMAGGRQRLPKNRACVDYWADWFGGAPPRRGGPARSGPRC
jgi:DNA-binding transcriptional LysR family regulator